MPARKRIDDSGFADHITDLLAPWGVDLAIKRMLVVAASLLTAK